MSVAGGFGGGGAGVPVFRSSHSRGDDGPRKPRKPQAKRRAPRAKKQPIELTAVLSVPHGAIGYVIGKAGAHVKQVQERSGARVQVAPKDDSRAEGTPVDVRMTGSARAVFSAAQLLATHLASCQLLSSTHTLPCRLLFAGAELCGQLTIHPSNPDLYHLFEGEPLGHPPRRAVAVVSVVDVSVGEEHVDAAVDDAVFVHGGAAGRDVDAWLCEDPRRLFAWALQAESAEEVLASIQTSMSEETEEVRSPLQRGAEA